MAAGAGHAEQLVQHAHRVHLCATRPPCRWPWQKALSTLSSWDSIRAALVAARPSPWGALTLLMVGSFVRSVVEQFAQVGVAPRCVSPCCAARLSSGPTGAVCVEVWWSASTAGAPNSAHSLHVRSASEPWSPLWPLLQSYVAEQHKQQLQQEVARLAKQH